MPNMSEAQNHVGFVFDDVSTWTLRHFAVWCTVVLCGLELLSFLINHVEDVVRGKIPVGGRPLLEFSSKDKAFIAFNKLSTVFFTYHVLFVTWRSNTVHWKLEELTVFNTVGSLIAFYIIYDLFYTLFHRALHLRSIYKYIHKHHHRQIVPFRGNLDVVVNVHPFEFRVGEYIHLACIVLVPCHIASVFAFIVFSGIMTSLNHTRIDARLYIGTYVAFIKCDSTIYWHHRIPTVNYGQYTMLWDQIFGSFQPYSKADNKSKDEQDQKETN